jgi:hypothetical protein
MQGAENLSQGTEVTNLSNPLYQQNFTSVPAIRVRNQNNHMKIKTLNENLGTMTTQYSVINNNKIIIFVKKTSIILLF